MKTFTNISLPQPSKPLLIVLEGPAGAGKTTLQRHLQQELRCKGVAAECIPEFSESDLGNILRDKAQYGESKPEWTRGLGGTLAFLADKINLIEQAPATSSGAIWICDRLVTSQLVLSLRETDDDHTQRITEDIILLTLRWTASRFSNESLMIFLEAPREVLEERLSRRLGRSLTASQSFQLQDEIDQYRKLSSSLKGWNRINLASTTPSDLLSQRLINSIPPRWLN